MRSVLLVTVSTAAFSLATSPLSAQTFQPIHWMDSFDNYASDTEITTQSNWEPVTKDSGWIDEDLWIRSSIAFSDPQTAQLIPGTTVLYSYDRNPMNGLSAGPSSGQWCVSFWFRIPVGAGKSDGSSRFRILDGDDPANPAVALALVVDARGKPDRVYLEQDAGRSLDLSNKSWVHARVFIDLDAETVISYLWDQTNGTRLLHDQATWRGTSPATLRGLWVYGGPETSAGISPSLDIDDLAVENWVGDQTSTGMVSSEFASSVNPVPAGTSSIDLQLATTGFVSNGVKDPRGVLCLTGLDYNIMPALGFPLLFTGPLSLDGAGQDTLAGLSIPNGFGGVSLQIRPLLLGVNTSSLETFLTLGATTTIRFD